MRWLDDGPPRAVPASIRAVLLRQRIAKQDGDPACHERLGEALMELGEFGDAVEAFRLSHMRAPSDFAAWSDLVRCHLELRCPEEALAVCNRAEEAGHRGMINTCRGDALHLLGRHAEADVAHTQALTLDARWDRALAILLRRLASRPDGEATLAFNADLPPACRDTAFVRAYGAIALSRLGRQEEALHLVNLDRHVLRLPFRPPTSFGDLARFNRLLAEEILANPSPVTRRTGFNMNSSPPLRVSETQLALRAFVRNSFEFYIAEFAARGLDDVMRPPAAGRLSEAGVVLRGEGRNGQHVHGTGFLSAVYHVLSPAEIMDASDTRGALLLGCCDEHTGGYVPCWGTRPVKPEPGWLTIFPSHVFHDVVPSRTESPRISFAADLKPVAPSYQSDTPLQ